ncbi:DUF1800 family protein [Sphaerotilus montanus]|uniref:DUF1800 family protein n=1 Tax=Sphaerotilus montanus TaxID=522889 RepID=UPI003FA32C5C
MVTCPFLRSHAASAALLLALLAGCGGGSADAAPADTRTPARTAQALAAPSVLTVRAKGSLHAGVGPVMVVRLNQQVVGTVEVKNTADWADFSFSVPALRGGDKIDVVFTNDIAANGTDRNLYIAAVSDGLVVLLPFTAGIVIDRGAGAAAFDGLDLLPGSSTLASNGALRLTWPGGPNAAASTLPRRKAAARLLLQASFGPTPAAVDALAATTDASWITTQMALPTTDDFVRGVQARYDLGDMNRPGGDQYDPSEIVRIFWRTAPAAPDQLRKRTAFALHHLFMVSQVDANLWFHSRAYASYLDLLNRHAFGNFRTLIEEIALSPAMGIYLSHLRNRKEDPSINRQPDENFARELMQLFTIGLQELNPDGSPKLDSTGQPIDTYRNADVMALAKVFTGFTWGFPDGQMSNDKFGWLDPTYTAAGDQRVDLQRMKALPDQHSTAEKKLFTGKPWAVTLPAGSSAQADVKAALDTLFQHPNVGPFIGRQLIQQLVTSQPSAAYVGRVAAVFNNNGAGVRGDLGAVVRAILLDTEARTIPAPTSPNGKLREPVLGLLHWMRTFGATSTNGRYRMGWQLDPLGETPFRAPSVFGYFRPGYVPPTPAFAPRKATAPEFQILDENSVAAWVNLAGAMGAGGLGWVDNAPEVPGNHSHLLNVLTNAGVSGLLDEIDVLLLGGRMSADLRRILTEAVVGIEDASTRGDPDRVRLAVFLTLASPEFRIQR